MKTNTSLVRVAFGVSLWAVCGCGADRSAKHVLDDGGAEDLRSGRDLGTAPDLRGVDMQSTPPDLSVSPPPSPSASPSPSAIPSPSATPSPSVTPSASPQPTPRCTAPILVSTLATPSPSPLFTPSNFGVQPLAADGSTVWIPYFIHTADPAYAGDAVHDLTFNRLVDGVSARPAGSPPILNQSGAIVYDAKVATDDAGDAVFVWIQTVDTDTFTALLRSYRKSDGRWSAIETISGNVADHLTTLSVRMNPATGMALVAWTEGPFNAYVPSVRTYDVAADTMGAATALTPTGYDYSADLLDYDVEVDAHLTGWAVWMAPDASSVFSIYGVHLTAGVPDSATPTVLVAGGKTTIDDLVNSSSPYGNTPINPLRTLALSANGNAAILWRVYNYMSSGAKGQLLALRNIGGVWGSPEVVATATSVPWSWFDWGIDNQGNVVYVLGQSGGTSVGHAAPLASPWPTPRQVSAAGPVDGCYVAMDSVSGRAAITMPLSGALGASAGGVFYDPLTQTVSSPFAVDVANSGYAQPGQIVIDTNGRATVVFVQSIPYALGQNSETSAYEYVTYCQ